MFSILVYLLEHAEVSLYLNYKCGFYSPITLIQSGETNKQTKTRPVRGRGRGAKYPGPGPLQGAHKPGPRRHNNIDDSILATTRPEKLGCRKV